MRNLSAAFIVLILISCGKKKGVPPGILEPAKMQAVFWDYIRADVYTRDYIKKDSLKNDTLVNAQLQDKIFSYYRITREDFYKSYKYYSDHPELMSALVDSITAKQNRRNTQTQKPEQKQVKTIYE